MFINEEYLKEETPVGENVDVKKVLNWTKTVLGTHIEPILGEYFLSKLIERYKDEETTPADDKLIEKIKPALAWRSAAKAIFSMTYKLKNKGLQKQFGDFSQSASFEEVTFNVDEYNQNSKMYEKKILKFVCENIENYPEATDDRNKDGEVFKCKCNDGDEDIFNESFMVI